LTLQDVIMLFAAGLAGGAINAVAGGATLLTFPAMISAGIPPIMANASSSFALTPGHALGVWSDRSKLPKPDRDFWIDVCIMVLGSACGAVLLFVTPERYFELLVPALIGGATLLFAFGGKLKSWLAEAGEPRERTAAKQIFLAPAALYVGYFGAGAGIVMMALFAVTTRWDLRTSNAVKNLFGAVGNWCAIVIFIGTGLIAWPQTLVMLAGAVGGGVTGGYVLRFISATTLRTIVILAGTISSAVYAWRYWL
jgi:uncharacterized protein